MTRADGTAGTDGTVGTDGTAGTDGASGDGDRSPGGGSGDGRVERDTVALGAFEFECGESVPELEVAYEAHGDPGDEAVLVCHALTGSAHVASDPDGGDGASGTDPAAGPAGQAAAWWDDVVGPGKAVDTAEFYVVCANVPGSCYGTTGPASVDPRTGEPYGTDFPPVTVGDWTRAQRRLLDALGIDSLHAVVGGSVGGMNALDWAKRYPDAVDRVVAVAAAGRLDPQCLALDAVARRAITTDPDWQGGDYYGTGRRPTDGLAQARRIGHVMYLSKASMADRFGRRPADDDASRPPVDPAGEAFPYRDVESYLDYNAATFVDRFDANAYLYLIRAMDDYDLAAGHDSDADALAGFDGEALLVSFTGDWHFPVDRVGAVADAFASTGTPAAHHVVDSEYGHDAFLVEPGSVGPPVADFLADGVAGDRVRDADAGATGDSADTGPADGRAFAPVHAGLHSD